MEETISNAEVHCCLFSPLGEGVRFDHKAGSVVHLHITENQEDHSGG